MSGTLVKLRRSRGALPFIVLMAAYLSLGAVPSQADEQPLRDGWRLGLEIDQQSFETMSAGDARPTSRAVPGVRGSVDWLMRPNWGVTLSARFGGSWFDWSNPIYNTTGTAEDVEWDTRLGLDRFVRLGARGAALLGAGIEYGEARSWARSLGSTPGDPGGQDITDDGPHCYRTGAFVRFGMISGTWHRTALSAQVSESFYRAHALDPTFGAQFSWLGRSLSVSAGLTFEITGGHAGEQNTSGP